MEWLLYLESEKNDFHREDYYHAQTAAEIRKSWVKYPARVKLKNFLLKFGFVKESSAEEETPEERNMKSKRFWLASLGIKVKKWLS